MGCDCTSWLCWWAVQCFVFLFSLAWVISVFVVTKRKRSAESASATSSDVDVPKATRILSIDASSSSSFSGQLGYEYDVFLNFRGEDTRKGFTDSLYTALEGAGIRVFRDNEGLAVGEVIGPELLHGIKHSSISIPIFSENYASSKWCLEEFAFMMECREARKQIVLPVFYDVTPNQVQHQTGSYNSAFRQHAKKQDPDTVQRWRKALAEVGSLKGWELKNETNGYQGKLIGIIVTEVLEELKKAHLCTSKNLVGIDHKVEKVMGMLDVEAPDVRFVGIWGMGGIGKTTLAKVVYNRIADRFDACSFLQDVRETSKCSHNGVRQLQSQLVADLLRHDRQDFATVDEGINELRCRFHEKKVLILLDDVDHVDQLSALAAEVDWFGQRSRIIMTTRNKDVLRAVVEERRVYEVGEMEEAQALQLFCKHALRRDDPTIKLRALSEEIVRTTGGLPLALEVIGSFLHGKSEEMWRATSKKLKLVPNKEVEYKLRISYDDLEPRQKQMFLDIACLFPLHFKVDAACIWEDCYGFPPEADIEALQQLSLIKINDDDGFEMHDQLRDLGREIVRRENYKEPGERSRLWGKEAIDVLQNYQGTSKIEAVRIMPKERVVFSNKCFQNLSRLRILWLVAFDGLFAGDYQHLLPELRWLRLWGESVSPPANLALNNLLVLDIFDSNINEEWIGWSSIKMGRLKILKLWGCDRLRRISGFSAFPNLERLNIQECLELDSIDPSIELLKNLKYLILVKCFRLEKLPDQLGYLEALVVLYVDYAPIEEIPISTRMKKLEVLSANYCYHLNRIPESIGSLVNLKVLSLVECSSLRELPETIGQLKSLIELDLQSSGITYLPKALGNLKELHVMNVNGCTSLQGVPSSIGSLSLLRDLTLYLAKSNRLPESISGLSHLQDLHLYIRRCWNHQTLPELPSNLISLTVEGSLPRVFPARTRQVKLREGAEDLIEESGELDFCGDHTKLKEDCLAKLFKLEKLVLRSVNIKALPEEIGSFSQLKEIEIARCTKLEYLPTLPSNLCLLGVYDCSSLRKFPSLSNLRKLSELYVHNMRLREINGLGDLISLKNLSLHDCPSTMLDGVERLESLRGLSIASCDIQRLPQLSKLRRLSRLYASDNRQLVDAQGIDNLPELEWIDFSNCTSLERLPDLAKLQRLECLELASCKKLSQLEGLEKLESLQRLDIDMCKTIEKLPDLSKLQNLSCLSVIGCKKLRHLEGLGELTSLKKLFTIGCKAKLPNMSKLQNLQVLWIEEFENLCQLDNIKEPGSVKDFKIYECRSTKLSDLSRLQNLQTLKMRYCKKLNRLESPNESENLAELEDISGCNAIERLSDLSKLKNLKKLDMEAWEKPDQIEGLEELESLENLALSKSKSIKELPNLSKLSRLAVLQLKYLENLRRLDMIENLRSLENLEISWCEAIQKLPQLSNLQNLRYLRITDCEKLSQLDGIQELGLLQELDISRCKAIEMLPELSKLQSLRHMNIIGCEKLIRLDGMGKLISLKQLNISWCKAIEELPEMSKLWGLQRLIMRGCKKMKRLDAIEELGSLEHLDISYCKAIKKLPGLSRLSKLLHLNMRGCETLNRVDEIGGLVSLKQLDISECKAIGELPDLSKLQSLWHLNMRSCGKLRRVDGLEELQSLEELVLSRFKSMEKLPDLSKLQRLRWLRVEACEELHKLGLEKLESLEHLDISRCRTIGKLPDLSKLQRLRSLEVKACENLHQLDRLEELESLRKLDISGSKAIEKLPKLSKNYNLSILYMRGCGKLRQLDGLGELTSLEELDISCCNAIENIPNLAMLRRLSILRVKACKNLCHLEGIEGLNQLEELDMSGCKAIEQLPNLSQLQRLRDLRMEGCENIFFLIYLHLASFAPSTDT